jgi:hypothetical protein
VKTYIGNAFSLNMVSGDTMFKVKDVSPDSVPADAVSCIGHESTAKVVSQLLDREIPMSRNAVSLEQGDCIYVVTLYTQDGKPYRAPEGVILGADGLAQLRVLIKRVTVGGPTIEQVICTIEDLLPSVGVYGVSIDGTLAGASITCQGKAASAGWHGYQLP